MTVNTYLLQVLSTYPRIRYRSGRLNKDDLLDKLDAAHFDRVQCGVPSLEDIVFDSGHLLPYRTVVRVVNAVDDLTLELYASSHYSDR